MSPSTNGQTQTAGLSTAESDSSMNVSWHASSSSSSSGQGGDGATPPKTKIAHSHGAAVPPSSAVASPSKRAIFSIASQKRKSTNKSRDGISMSQSISNSAPTVLIHTPSTFHKNDDPNAPPLQRPLRSAMSSRTLHESLHRGLKHPRSTTVRRTVSFANVNIREFERILGDNPSVTSGPPLGIGWRHALEPIVMNLDEYEEGKGDPRTSAEYLVPRAVRESLIREHAGASRREIAHVVRNINREKAQRRKTVVNLSMQKTEERFEGARRKIKKILKPSGSYRASEERLWDEAHAVAMEKARRLEESMRRGESVSMRNVYSVGTPCNNILPSRRNSTRILGGGSEGESQQELVDRAAPVKMGGYEAALKSTAEKFTPKSTTNENLPQSSEGEIVEPIDRTGATSEGDILLSSGKADPQRASANIVASETESEEIFAQLVLDDASHES